MTSRGRTKRGLRRKRQESFPTIPLRQRIRSGAEYGLIMGVLFGGMATLLALFNGGELPRRHSEDGVLLLPVLFAYLVMGPITGFLYGLAFPLMRARWSAFLVGAVVSFPISLAFAAAVSAPDPWFSERALLVAVIGSLTLGGFGGVFIRAATLE